MAMMIVGIMVVAGASTVMLLLYMLGFIGH
jgi:hypothetical protein